MGKAQTRAKRKYNEANYYRVALTIPKSQAEPLKQYVEQRKTEDNKLTVNKLLNNYITELLKNTNTSILENTSTSIYTNTSTTELIEEINDLKKQLEDALKEKNDLTNRLKRSLDMDKVKENQELVTLKSEISSAFRLICADFHNSKQKEYSQDLFEVYRSYLSNIFKGFERLGISFNNTNTSILEDTKTSIDDTENEKSENTNTSIIVDDTNASINDTSTSISEPSKPEKPKRKPPPKQEEKEQWEREYNSGLPAKRIAEMFGRDIRAVKKHLEQAGLTP